MKPASLRITLTLGLLILSTLACQAVNGTATPAPDSPASPTEAATEPAASLSPTATTQAEAVAPPPVVSQGPGLACIGTKSAGAVCLDANGWQIYTTENSGLSSNYITAVAACPNGRIAFAHYDGVSLFDGQEWTSVSNGDFTSIDALACDAQGGLWAAHFQGASHFADGQWTKYGADQLATGESVSELVYDVAVAPDGKVWVVTSNSVAAFDGQEWSVYQQGRGFDDKLYFSAVAFDPQGRTLVAFGDGLASFENEQWTLIKSTDYVSSVVDLAVDAQGRAWLGTLINGVYSVKGGEWSNQTFEKTDLSSNDINSVAVDASGRVWVASEYGLNVLVDGKWQVFRMDNSELPANDVRGLALIKDGPPLPATADKPTGQLTGQVKNADGSPVADSTVEICVQTLGTQFFGETPCSDQPYFLTGKSDAEGNFRFENVPAGYYTIVMQVGDGWAQLTGDIGGVSEQVLVEPGETAEVGEITMKE